MNKQKSKVRCLNTWLDFYSTVLSKSSSNNSTQTALKICHKFCMQVLNMWEKNEQINRQSFTY